MHLWIFEENLIWSSRLKQSAQALGHSCDVLQKVPSSGTADAAIVNLGAERLQPSELVQHLKSLNVPVIGHAGHKEKALIQSGNEWGCDVVVSNSTLTYKLDSVLQEFNRPASPKLEVN